MKIIFTPSIDDLYNAQSDYDFGAALTSSDRLMELGDTEKACQQRYDAAVEILEQIDQAPEDLELDMNNSDNHPLVELLCNSGLDHYYICDFEMAATMFEAALQLDSEDHFDVLTPLAYCYAAMGEQEALDDVQPLLKFSRVEQDFFDGFAAMCEGREANFSTATTAELNNTDSELYSRVGHLLANLPQD